MGRKVFILQALSISEPDDDTDAAGNASVFSVPAALYITRAREERI